MLCTHHSETPATAVCTRCDQPLCDECSTPRGQRVFCSWCTEFLTQRADRRAKASGGSNGTSPAHASAPSIEATGGATADPPPGLAEAGPPEVYDGSSAIAAPMAAGPSAESGREADSSVVVVGSMARAVLFCGLAVAVSIALWYGLTVATERVFALASIGVGFLVGIAAVAGAGRGGLDVAMLSVGSYLVAILGGEFLSWRHLIARWAEEEGMATDSVLTFGEFLPMIPGSFSLVGWAIVGFGAWEAFKITTRGVQMA